MPVFKTMQLALIEAGEWPDVETGMIPPADEPPPAEPPADPNAPPA